MARGRSAAARGFTLIEMLVVVAVIGTVAAITVPAVGEARARGESTAAAAEVASYQNASASYLAETGNYPVPDPVDVPDSCVESDANGVNPQLCCVAGDPERDHCVYAGHTLRPLSHGAYANNGSGILRGALPRLPRLPTRPIAAGPLQYQGVFHSCNDAACQRPTVTWTQPTACPAGLTRNSVTGLCQAAIDRSPVVVREQTETYCYDGADNDHDGATDCADSNCAGRARCGLEVGSTFCADVFDNDADGKVDCADPGCAGAGACGGLSESGACSNGEDEDGDGAIDCADTDCDGQIGENNTYCQPYGETQCNDLVDNDGDGAIDCADGQCAGIFDCGAENCSNGIDDDGDGLVDCGDPSCAPGCGPAETGARCANNVDDDLDGQTDCNDADCYGSVYCNGGTHCYDISACNYGQAGDCEYTSCVQEVCSDPGACNYAMMGACDYVSCTCQDSNACNYGSPTGCDYDSCYCRDEAACNNGERAECDYSC